MPSESTAQHNFFEAVDHNKRFAEKAGVSQKVAGEYVEADKHSDQWKKQDHVPSKDGK